MQQQPNALRGPSQSGPSPGTATLGCGQGRGVLMRRAAPSVRARVLLGHAVEGDAALCRLRGPGQLGLPERGVSPWARPPSPSSPKGRPRTAQHRRCLRRPQPTEGASSSWSSAATGWSRWCWCSCRSATSKWNTWAVTSPGNSTSTTSTIWPPPTGTWFATGHPLAPAP
ncbi:transmembrane protein 249 isoform X4 [Trachypithecus francoisi]|uniref:transmembrane protein 249 isoform X4 n=1 Tax=Trachypithecus francoisi TaxID=54180 RepID=UPI00141AE33B|nr:transmembrane protein 249 isoform X4 [Trachypithecus francoisi]